MKRMLILAVLAGLLCGCSAASGEPVPSVPDSSRLTVFSCLEETVCTPLVREYQERTGVFVTVETGCAGELLERIAGGEECDLLLGCETDQLEADKGLFQELDGFDTISDACPRGQNWVPVSLRAMVIVYNPKLIRQNPPTGLDDLLEDAWQGKIAFADPGRSAFSGTVLEVLAQGGDADARIARFAGNVGELLQDTESVIQSVADGSCFLAVVPEDAAARRIRSGLDLTVVYPKSGIPMAAWGAAIPTEAPHPENAMNFVSFLLGRDAQSYGRNTLLWGSVLDGETDFPKNALFYDPITAGADRAERMEQWNAIREDTP